MSATTVVYRVQDKDGRGPWKPGFSSRWVEDRDDLENLIPWPIEFPRAMAQFKRGMAYGCACLSLEQLRRWFTPTEYVTLQRYGYKAVKMEVGAILGQSTIQCVFERITPLREGVEPIELYTTPPP